VIVVGQQECKILWVGKHEERKYYVILTVHFLTINISSNIMHSVIHYLLSMLTLTCFGTELPY